MAFYAVHAPPKAHLDNVTTAWKLFGPRIWDELERKYRGKTAGFRPPPGEQAAAPSSPRSGRTATAREAEDDYNDDEFD